MNRRNAGFRADLTAYAVQIAITALVLTVVFDLHRVNWSVPWEYSHDSLMYHGWTKTTQDYGSVWNNPRLGAPGTLVMYDFPSPDLFALQVMRVMGWFGADWAVAFNLYYLLGFAVTGVAAQASLRGLGFSRFESVCGALLFNFLPYHFLRRGHLYLTVYGAVPVAAAAALRLLRPVPPFFATDPADGKLRFDPWSLRSLGTALGCAAVAILGPYYYGFFACIFFAFGGVMAWATGRGRPAVLSSLMMIVIVVVSAAAVLTPVIHQRLTDPTPPFSLRGPTESDVYGLRLSEMFLPTVDHRIGFVRNFRNKYQNWMPRNESVSSALGLACAVGLAYLLLRLIFLRRTPLRGALTDGAASLSAAGMLFALAGGFAPAFAVYFTAQFRTPNRISLFIAYFALVGLLMLRRALLRRLADRPRTALWLAAGLPAAVAFAFVDQIPRSVPFDIDSIEKSVSADAKFGAELESRLPQGAAVFQLPYIEYPEAVFWEPFFIGYEHLRPYLHTRTLRFSFGTMRGRPGDAEYSRLAKLPPEQLIRELADLGFAGILIDPRGYTEEKSPVAEWRRLLGEPTIERGHDPLLFFPLPKPPAR